ncbi:MAG: hypothetical protein HY763_14335 [Planctomycetes bacterium]|nr:hypothetical protein [Planctomycetota bacterium]
MNETANNPADPFSRFWMDMMSRMTSAAMPAAAPTAGPLGASPLGEEYLRTMRQAFFDAWAKYCDEYLGSEPFLEIMRKSMENALAFKRQVNEFLAKSVHEAQMPSREDTDSIMLVLRSMEERVLDRLEKLSQRVEALEARGAGGPSTAATAAARSQPPAPDATRGGKRPGKGGAR